MQSNSISVFPRLANSSYIAQNREQLCCLVCLEQVSGQEAVSLSCGHKYDVECFKMLVMSSLGVDSVRPARCCDIFIPLELVEKHLSADIATTYTLKHREHTTRNRVYCANPSCAQFLGPLDSPTSKSPSHSFRCSRLSCQTVTCSACRKCVDPCTTDHLCELEQDDEELKALRDTEGWATCPGCDSFIEKQEGCSTIVCRCGTRFCYTCSNSAGRCVCRTGDLYQIPFKSSPPNSDPEYPTLLQLHLAHRWRFARLERERMGLSSHVVELAMLAQGEDVASRRMRRGSSEIASSEHKIPPRVADQWPTSLSTQPEIRTTDQQHAPHSQLTFTMIPTGIPGGPSTFPTHPFEQLLHRPTSLSSSFGSQHHTGIQSDSWKLAYSNDPGVDFAVYIDG